MTKTRREKGKRREESKRGYGRSVDDSPADSTTTCDRRGSQTRGFLARAWVAPVFPGSGEHLELLGSLLPVIQTRVRC